MRVNVYVCGLRESEQICALPIQLTPAQGDISETQPHVWIPRLRHPPHLLDVTPSYFCSRQLLQYRNLLKVMLLINTTSRDLERHLLPPSTTKFGLTLKATCRYTHAWLEKQPTNAEAIANPSLLLNNHLPYSKTALSILPAQVSLELFEVSKTNIWDSRAVSYPRHLLE